VGADDDQRRLQRRHRTDYTFDASTSADVNVSGGKIIPVVGAALTAERGARHTARGYDLLEGQATVKSTPVTTITSYKFGVRLRASAATTYIEVYVDDNGTNSRLRIDVVIAGVRTNRATTNLAVRLPTSTAAWVRGRIEYNPSLAQYAVTAEHFTAAPTPMSAPTTTTSYTLVAGDAPLDTTAGKSGWSWVPQNASATLDDFEFRPYTYRNQTLPQRLRSQDAIPGTAPALVDASVTPSGGSATPAWALIAWGRDDVTAAAFKTLQIIEAESLTLGGGWASSAQAGARGGNDVRVTTAGVGTYTASASVEAMAVQQDDFTDGQIDVEIWARVLVSSTNVEPRLAASVGAFSTRYTPEFGSTGKLIVKPSAGTVYRFVRLGTLTIDTSGGTDAATNADPIIGVTGTVAAGSAGAFGLDYLVYVPIRRRACMVTAQATSTVVPFVPSTAEWTKVVRADLAGTLRQESTATTEGHSGIGGALIEPSPGLNLWLVKLSSLQPDDPTSTRRRSNSRTRRRSVSP
jgi:hypothetical protein